MPSLLLLAVAFIAADPEHSSESITVTVVGTLKTGIVAIGGETTGATITSGGITWEVDCGNDAKLRDTASGLSGQQVRLHGTLELRAGIEVKERWIIHVSSLQAIKMEPAGAGPKRKPEYQSAVETDGSKLTLLLAKDQLVIDCSGTGIGKAAIHRNAANWPKTVVVRIHTKGLEGFQAGTKDLRGEWSVSSSPPHESRMSLRRGGEEEIVLADSPDRTQVKHVPAADAAGIAAHYEVPLPASFFENNPVELHVQWVDFYRR